MDVARGFYLVLFSMYLILAQTDQVYLILGFSQKTIAYGGNEPKQNRK